jgi:hypothetical protein
LGWIDGTPANAEWNGPLESLVAKDPISGFNSLFIADTYNSVIRQIYLEGPNSGLSQTIAGNGVAGDRTVSDPHQCKYNTPKGLAAATDQFGVITTLYIADSRNCRIKTLAPVSGAWQPAVLAGTGIRGSDPGPGSSATFNEPSGITVDANGFVYVADANNHLIRKIDTSPNANVSNLADTSVLSALSMPTGITAGKTSTLLYFADSGGNIIGRLNPDGSNLITFAGTGVAGFNDGSPSAAQFNSPFHLAWSNTGGTEVLFIADQVNQRIRILNISALSVATFAGSGARGSADGACNVATFKLPSGVAVGLSTEVYVMDSNNNLVRKVQ